MENEKKEVPATEPEIPGISELLTDVSSLLVTNKQDAERVEAFRQVIAKIKEQRNLARMEMAEANRAKKEAEADRKIAEKKLAEARETLIRAEEKSKLLIKTGQGSGDHAGLMSKLDELNKAGNFSDAEYLTELFEGGELKYLKSVAKESAKKGFPATPLLTEYLFLTTVNHRLHIEYITAGQEGSGKSIQNAILRVINDNQVRISSLEESLTKLANDNKTGVDVTSLHQTVLEEGEKFIRAHIGEFSFQCQGCNTVVMSDGLPHWALRKGMYEGSPFYFVFSRELWSLVLQKKIPISFMAFILRTSIIGIKWTVEARKEKWPDWIDVPAEEAVLKYLMEEYRFAGMEEQAPRIKKLGMG